MAIHAFKTKLQIRQSIFMKVTAIDSTKVKKETSNITELTAVPYGSLFLMYTITTPENKQKVS